MDWITCPGCGLKHSPRPDGLCPRCRTQIGAAGAGRPLPPNPAFERARFDKPPSPSAPQGAEAEPMPTTPWRGGQAPLPTTPVGPAAPPAEISVGSLVSRTFSVWWANFGRFTALLAVAVLPMVVAAVFFGAAAAAAGPRGAEGVAPAVLPAVLVGWLLTVVLVIVQFGGITYGTLQHLAGRPASFGAMFGAGWRRAWPLFVAGFLTGLLVWAGMLLLVVPGVIAALAALVALPAVVAEGAGGVAAIKRSFALTRGSRGTLFGALFVIFLALIGGAVVANLLMALSTALGPLGVLTALGTLVVQASMAALSTVLCAVAYHDLRVAKEGVDTSQLAQVFE